MAGRPPAGGGVEIRTERTRARRPRAAAEAAAADTLRAGGAQVFSLHGGPVEFSDQDAGGKVDAAPVVLDWYRSREAKGGA